MKIVLVYFITAMLASANAGPLAVGICYAGCCTVATACYSAAGGLIYGTITAAAARPAILACNSALGSCMSACTVAFVAPTP